MSINTISIIIISIIIVAAIAIISRIEPPIIISVRNPSFGRIEKIGYIISILIIIGIVGCNGQANEIAAQIITLIKAIFS